MSASTYSILAITACAFGALLAAIVLKRKYLSAKAQLAPLEESLKQIRERFQAVIDVDAEKTKVEAQLQEARSAEKAVRLSLVSLAGQEADLKKQISIYGDELISIDCGLYTPSFDFATSEKFKAAIDGVRDEQKRMLKEDRASACTAKWTVNGSEVEGRKQTKHYTRLMLRAFNGESDAIIANVKWNNITRMIERLENIASAINKLGETHQIRIQKDYVILKHRELQLTYEYQEKLHSEKEEQRRIQEQIREEEKAQRELDRALKEAEDDEKKYAKALEKARDELEHSHGLETAKMQDKVALLEQQLKEALAIKERAISRAQLTKSGHVYVISNIGSFGENRFKIGMTRRLEPMDRIKELGDASVPFEFDVHAMIYSENAPELEGILHDTFAGNRVNLVNERKEFFDVSIDEIAEAVQQRDAKIEIIKIPEARDYRETVSIRESLKPSVSVAPIAMVVGSA
jgi:hypothetical protein